MRKKTLTNMLFSEGGGEWILISALRKCMATQAGGGGGALEVVEEEGEEEGEIVVAENPLKSVLRKIDSVVKPRNTCFGDDMVLTEYRRRYSVVSLTFLETHVLTKKALSKVLQENYLPGTRKMLRK